MKHESGWKKKSKEEVATIFDFSEGYKRFLDRAKTEREAVRVIRGVLASNGFTEDWGRGRVYRVNRGKEIIAFAKGTQDLVEGFNIIVAHIDAPRLDLKQNPLYEDVDLGLLRTHYYGGIKKYQWVATPLSIHGIVVKTDGREIDLVIGENDDEPVFSIDDLLPHLSRKTQDEKKLSEAIDGEKLTLLFGSIPLDGEEKEAVKKGIGAYPVILPVGPYHAPVNSHIPCLKGRDNLNFRADEVFLLNAVFILQESEYALLHGLFLFPV